MLLTHYNDDDSTPPCQTTLPFAGLDENKTYRVTVKPVGMKAPEKTFTLTPACRTLTPDLPIFDACLVTVKPQ